MALPIKNATRAGARLASRTQVVPAVRRAVAAAASKEPKIPEINIDTDAMQTQATEMVTKAGDFISTAWEKTEEKPAAVAITVSAFIALWALNSVVDAVDRLPLFGDLFEMVGVVVTGWFVYRYLIFGPDREELVQAVKGFLSKVAGNKSSSSSSSSSNY